MASNSCTVGFLVGKSVCVFQKNENRELYEKKLSLLSPDVIEILTLRAKLHHGQLSSDSTICKYHEDYYLVDFKLHDGHGKNCCDPYKCHPSKIRKGSRTITLSQSRKLSKTIKLIPGLLFCVGCNIFVQGKIDE